MIFKKAKKIFPSGTRGINNIFAGFYRQVTLQDIPESVKANIAARTFYKLYINGVFVSYGPARAAHEHARIDEIDITPYLRTGTNHFAAEVVCYTKQALCGTGENGFFAAEISAGETVLDHTDINWHTFMITEKLRDTPDYSGARFSAEAYRLNPDCHTWRTGENLPENETAEEMTDPVTYLPRTAAFPDFHISRCFRLINTEGADRALLTDKAEIYAADGSSVDFDAGTLQAGFIGIDITVDSDAEAEILFPEKLAEQTGEPESFCSYSHVKITLQLQKGRHRFESFEPYALRYVRVGIKNCPHYILSDIYIRSCAIKDLYGGFFSCDDADVNRIYTACRNAVPGSAFDIFMDCSGRERGGWAADAYWTSQAARMFLGDESVEKCHLENMLAPSVPRYCDVHPGVYPAGGKCDIHNWTIMFLLELYQYYRRTADADFLDKHRPMVEWTVSTLEKYQNKSGLLENLDRIVYADGTTSGTPEDRQHAPYNRPISVPTNAMYALALKQLGGYYKNTVWTENAEKIRAVLKKAVSFTDRENNLTLPSDAFSMDDGGNITRNGYSSEAAQYFIMWTNLITREEAPHYYHFLLDCFGRAPSVPISNTRFFLTSDFHMGTNARMEVLAKYGEIKKLLDEIKAFSLYMIDNGPGTLWEGWSRDSSMSHSFVSWFGMILERELLGLHIPDAVNRTIDITPHPLHLKWAKGFITAGEGVCSLRWNNTKDAFNLHLEVPPEYTAELTLPDEVLNSRRTAEINGRKHIALPANGILTGIKGRFDFSSKL